MHSACEAIMTTQLWRHITPSSAARMSTCVPPPMILCVRRLAFETFLATWLARLPARPQCKHVPLQSRNKASMRLPWRRFAAASMTNTAGFATSRRLLCSQPARRSCKSRQLRLQAKYAWVTGLSAEDAAWMAELPFTLSIPSRRIIITHAGVLPGVPLSQQSLADLYTVRDISSSIPACLLANRIAGARLGFT